MSMCLVASTLPTCGKSASYLGYTTSTANLVATAPLTGRSKKERNNRMIGVGALNRTCAFGPSF